MKLPNALLFLLIPATGCFAQTPPGKTQYNGIVLPAEWPPAHASLARGPADPPPYLAAPRRRSRSTSAASFSSTIRVAHQRQLGPRWHSLDQGRFLQRVHGELYSFWVAQDQGGASHGYVAAGGPGCDGLTDLPM